MIRNPFNLRTNSFFATGTADRWKSLAAFIALMLLLVSGLVFVGGNALAGASPGGLTQAGDGTDGGVTLPSCGPSWVIVQSSLDGGAVSESRPGGAVILPDELWGVSALSSSDAWAVGDGPGQVSDEAATLVEHWNGSAWTYMSSPSPGTVQNTLKGVAAASASDAWAVGYDDAAPGTLIEHWNGSAWGVITPTTGSGALSAVAAVDANDVWAVGAGSGTLVEHWNGSTWAQVSSPSPGTGGGLASLAVRSAHDIWTVGYYYDGSVIKTLIENWNGTIWRIIPSPNQGTSDNRLNSVSIAGANSIWAVGTYAVSGTSKTLIEHWNGTAWTIISSPNEGTSNNVLSGVAAVALNDAWAVGSYYDAGVGAIQTLAEHYNGSSWSIVSTPNGNVYNNQLAAIAAASPNDFWAVGSSASSISRLWWRCPYRTL